MKWFRTFWLIVLGALWTFAFEAIDGNEGEKCDTSELPGICAQLRECAIAMNSIRRGRPHNLKRCGFNGFEEVVCCPSAASRNPSIESTTKDKGLIWDDKNGDNNEIKYEETIDHKPRGNSKRKCEKACDKMIKENNILPVVQFNIIDGEDAKLGDFPHMAAMGFQTSDESAAVDWQLCAASLISERFLVTAAHCFINQLAPELKIVRLGVIQINSTSPKPQDYQVESTILHPKYNTRTRHNDIALVKLRTNVRPTKYVRPACLYSENDDPTGLMVTGWGDVVRGTAYKAASILQVASLNPVSTSKCNSTLMSKSVQQLSGRSVVATQICAMSPSSDACQGDSGGPLQIQRIDGAHAIVGIVSYGSGCGGDTPGVYTRISRFLSWIEDYVWPSD